MIRIALLLLAGAIPVLSQFQHFQQNNRFPDYGDYGGQHFNRNNNNHHNGNRGGNDFGQQQQSFFDSFNANSNGANSDESGGFSGGGLSAPAPPNHFNNNNYFGRTRNVVVPPSLSELEESYIRSLSTTSRTSTTQPFLDPYSENRNILPHQQQQSVESYAGFIPKHQRPFSGTHYNRNEHLAQLAQQQNHQQPLQNNFGQFPPQNKQQQISASNSIESPFSHKELNGNGKFFDYSQTNNVPNFPDFSDPPPVPEEPFIPPESELEKQPPEKLVIPTPEQHHGGFGNKIPPSPLASPPPVFDPTFPEPVLQRGFIPSFGPPTKLPLNRPGPVKEPPVLQEQDHNYLPSAPPPLEATGSPIPLLRPEYPKDKERNALPDEVESLEPERPRKGKIFKHISVHVPAEDLDEDISEPQIVKVQKEPEKHLKLIFIKPPETPTPKTEVEVAPTPPHKTLVYLLSESGGARTPIKLVTPPPLKVTPPQVFFLRYKDTSPQPRRRPKPHRGPDNDKLASPESVEDSQGDQPIIKDLTSPFDPDAELLRSAPAPILPTFNTLTGPGSAALSQLALQSTLASPTVFTNINANPNTNFLTPVTQPTSNTNQLTTVQINPSGFSSVPAHATSPYSPHYYSSLFHLYPPPALASIPSNQNLLPMYFNPLHQQFQFQPPHLAQPQQLYQLDQSKSESKLPPASLQGLHSVPPYRQGAQGTINLKSLIQNTPSQSLPPRPGNNLVMMTYAPGYMPSASGSEPAPVFSSPAAFIKSLLGDSYMFYNNTGSNNTIFHHQLIPQPTPTLTGPTPTIIAVTSGPAEIALNNTLAQLQATNYALPSAISFDNLQNLSRVETTPQAYSYVIGSTYGADQKGKIHFQNPLITGYSSPPTLTTTRQPRISFPAISTTGSSPSASPQDATTKHVIQLPILVYDPKSSRLAPEDLTTGDSVTAHLARILQGLEAKQRLNRTDHASHTQDEDDEEEEEISENAQGSRESSMEESSPTDEPLPLESSELDISDSQSSSSSNNSSESATPKRSGRRRVNPALVKPGRRLRKVRKPNKGEKQSVEGDGSQSQN